VTASADGSDDTAPASPVARAATKATTKVAHALSSPRGRRIARQFLPLQLTTVNWDVLSSGRRFLGFLLAASVLNTVQVEKRAF
jgi:hypothetical protein